jgi:subtilisin family serine protease
MKLRRAPAVLAIGFCVLATSSVAVGFTDMPGVQAGGNQNWIVTVRRGQDPQAVGAQAVGALGGRIEHVYRHALLGFSFRGSAAAAQALTRNPDVLQVVADRELRAVGETLPWGIKRIDALHPEAPDAHEAGFTGAGVSIGILDTGIDLDHPDLNVDVARGLNCMGSGPPEDGHGHGTHVAGTAAAVRNGDGVVGVAPDAVVVPIKVLDDSGVGTDATVICGIDYLTALATDGDPTNDIAVANMSLGEQGAAGNCTDGGLHEAMCESIAAGVTYVVAAGNSSIDASGFVPAAYPEVITVSAMVDLDGEPGGAAGCYLFIYCDDDFAFFSDYGAVVDVIAPGVNIYSTWMGGGYRASDGTSMAAPHVAGVAALVKAANPALAPVDIEALLATRGECPNGTGVEAGDNPRDCVLQGQWDGDPDGQAEPLVNALRSASAAATWDPLPSVTITSPLDGAGVSGIVTVTAAASDDAGINHVVFERNGAWLADDVNGSDGWSASWDTAGLSAGVYSLSAIAYDTAAQWDRHTVSVSIGANPQGDWVGSFGQDGYALAAWNGTTATSDLAVLPAGASLTLQQGYRYRWSAATADVRALEAPDQSTRRAGTYADTSQVRLRLDFASAYAGTLHLYALDWDNKDRRQTVSVSDGTSTQTIAITTNFSAGAWLHFPVNLPAGGSLTITATKNVGMNAVLGGVFLGD